MEIDQHKRPIGYGHCNPRPGGPYCSNRAAPDFSKLQTEGYCEACGVNTVVSVLSIASNERVLPLERRAVGSRTLGRSERFSQEFAVD